MNFDQLWLYSYTVIHILSYYHILSYCAEGLLWPFRLFVLCTSWNSGCLLTFCLILKNPGVEKQALQTFTIQDWSSKLCCRCFYGHVGGMKRLAGCCRLCLYPSVMWELSSLLVSFCDVHHFLVPRPVRAEWDIDPRGPQEANQRARARAREKVALPARIRWPHPVSCTFWNGE